MTKRALIIDGSELFDDAVERFAAAAASDRIEDAERFAELAFYLAAHEVRPSGESDR